MWILQLNCVNHRYEELTMIGYADTENELVAFIKSQEVELYRDGRFRKSYRQGGFLEWYNPPDRPYCIIDVGSEQDWIDRAKRNYTGFISRYRKLT